MIEIDTKRLPESALIDSGVLLRFTGQILDDRSPACVAFCSAMLAEGNDLLVAAPTIAEVSRKSGAPVPRTKGMYTVPFDDRAAYLLAFHLPTARLHKFKAATGLSHTYLKYDAMIMACALRAKAAAVVALDGDIPALAAATSIPSRRPEWYAAKQQVLAIATVVSVPTPPPAGSPVASAEVAPSELAGSKAATSTTATDGAPPEGKEERSSPPVAKTQAADSPSISRGVDKSAPSASSEPNPPRASAEAPATAPSVKRDLNLK